MSASPPKDADVEPASEQSPDEPERMDRDQQDSQAQGLAYEFEVKEQDRWLPIANGRYSRPFWSFPCSPCCALICRPRTDARTA